ncbi:arylamine N-acetyltransferase family protein [Intrasporangium sp. YIM S08009]|uniref:arylamine N-acetyltransferase family protein n=1 Tax=Intrasporangium zincisolvens TaxID=3080018 RepID=UPI002B05F89B|nr:arylamine N-acetyltransferase [Intrasporangium sp. YIM S08009]
MDPSTDARTEFLSAADAAAYARHIGATLPAAPTLGALSGLQRAHLLAVPFENLDIELGRPIRLDLDAFVDKVVRHRRGGYCYELNGLFAALLRTVGYRVDLVSAPVAMSGGGFTPEFDHLALVVDSEAMDERVLADVGFGAGFIEPLPLRDGFVRRERGTDVGLARDTDGTWTYRERPAGSRTGEWAPRYTFTTRPHPLADFAPRNEWQQTSPESHFTRQRLASRLTATGRVTLSGDRLITTTHGSRDERTVDASERPSVLAEHFGITLPDA